MQPNASSKVPSTPNAAALILTFFLAVFSNLPIGLQFDVIDNRDNIDCSPWVLEARIRSNMEPSALSSEKSFFHTLKQALFVLHGNTRRYNELTMSDQQLLWRFCCQSLSVAEDLAIESVYSNLFSTKDIVRALPVRLLVKGNLIPTQSACKAVCADGRPRTLSEVLREDFAMRESMLGEQSSSHVQSTRSNQVSAQGISLDLSASIYSIYCALHEVDLFLYIVIDKK
jgi:hypothetical protein